MKKISRRDFLAASAVVGAAGVLTACGGSSNSTAASTAGSAAASTAGGKSTDYPTKGISVICPWSAGGGTDSCLRAFCEAMGKNLVFFVKRFSLKKASEFPVFSKGFSLL